MCFTPCADPENCPRGGGGSIMRLERGSEAYFWYFYDMNLMVSGFKGVKTHSPYLDLCKYTKHANR